MVSNGSLFAPALLRTHSFVFFAVHPFSILSSQRRQTCFFIFSECPAFTLQATLVLSLVVCSLKSVCCDCSIFSAVMPRPPARPVINLVWNSVVAYIKPVPFCTRSFETRYVLIQCNTGTYSQTFFPSAIRLWNTPPVVICQLSPDSFKTHFSSFHFIWALDYIIFFYRLHCTVFIWSYCLLPSVLWYCWLGGRKGIQPVKNWVVRCWHGPYGICPSLCHSHSLSVALVKSRLVLPFWYRLTWVVPDKGSLNGSLCVCYSLL